MTDIEKHIEKQKEPIRVTDGSQPEKIKLMRFALVGTLLLGFGVLSLLAKIAENTSCK